MQVRSMALGELEAVVAVWRSANASRGKHVDAIRVARVRKKLTATDAVVHVAVEENSVVGMVLSEPGRADDGDGPIAADLLHISMVFVHPAAQRRGVGAALLGGALNDARAAGMRHASLWTATDNEPARRLYERVGMTAGETRPADPSTAWIRYACEL